MSKYLILFINSVSSLLLLKTFYSFIFNSSQKDKKLLLLINTTNILNTIHKKVLNKEPVLVHCSAGRQRSCAVVACYLIRFYNMTPLEAVDYIKSKRKVAFFGAINFSNTINQFYIEQKKLL